MTIPPPPPEREDPERDEQATGWSMAQLADEQAAVAYMTQLAEAEQRGERATIRVGPYSAMTMIGLLQFATRHPDMSPRMRKLARDFIDQFAPLFTGTPGAEIIRQGGHPDFDR